MTQPSDPILIVGAGIGGLFAGLCLQRKNIDFLILEKADELAEVGAGIQIGANGARLIYELGLREEFEKYALAPPHGLMMDGISGRQICTYPLSSFAQHEHGFPHYQILRSDLQRVLVETLHIRAPGKLHLASEITRIHQDQGFIKAETQDNRTYQGRAVVGCDGIHSSIRQLSFGKSDPAFSNCVAWRALLSASELEMEYPMVPRIWIGPGRHLVQYPVESGKSINLVACVDSSNAEKERWQGNSSIEELNQSFSAWCPAVQRLISKADRALSWGLYERPVLQSWTKGCVTLLGDAAHAMLPSMAQGAVMAMEDAYQLAESLANLDEPESAFKDYEAKRFQRCKKTQDVAQKNMAFFHQKGLANKVSAKALSLAGAQSEKLIGRRYGWLYGYEGVV